MQQCCVLYVTGRLNASVMAVKNCKRKAVELAQAVGARLGPVVSVREDFCHQSNDTTSTSSEVPSDLSRPVSVQEKVQQATLRITAKASVVFALQSLKNKNDKLH